MASRLEIAGVLVLCGVAYAAWRAPWHGPEAVPAVSAPPATEASSAEALAHQFESQVMAELARRSGVSRPAGLPRAETPERPRGTDRTPRLWNQSADDVHPRRVNGTSIDIDEAARRADWEYLNDVFAGRVTGIPNERKAGVSLFEMAALGNVPYVEKLRSEGDLDALRDLGFVPEPAPPAGPPKEWSGGEPVRERRFPLNPRLEGGQF